ncbi:hypothetical protein M5K25_020787 [Dendrobium thyrsiflorum]|uniref:Ribosome maturation factor RimP N-terminal domain-containing protein n=1 Tax=Dendrobium thyrsiflorum TaxID=117978 RepID=A0ABD0UAX9_DENTH
MDLAAGTASSNLARCFSPSSSICPRLYPVNQFVLRILPCASANSRRHSLICHGKGRGSYTKSSPKELTLKEQEEAEATEEDVEEAEKELEDEEAEYIEDFGDDMLANDETDFDDEFQDDNEDADPQVGDGGGGGGISLAGTWWDKEALAIAADVSLSFNGDLRIYSFKTSANSTIRLRIEKMSNKYGSPTMDDIEAFSSAYRLRLDEAEGAGTIPTDVSLEVSSPGVERVVRVPEELERFKDRPMYVKYTTMDAETGAIEEADGVFSLISFDLEGAHCIWGIADVKINRQKTGKGRPLSKKQRQWRLQIPFESLRLVRLHSDS